MTGSSRKAGAEGWSTARRALRTSAVDTRAVVVEARSLVREPRRETASTSAGRVAAWLVAMFSVTLAGLGGGCTALLSYPAEEPEDCTNGRDDDLDGAADCEDSDCWGRCAEEGALACANGRDDDGDGYTDALDPRCWPRASVEVTRCASVRGGVSRIPPSPGIGWDGVGDYEVDPSGLSTREVVGGIRRMGELSSVETFAGGWNGTSISTRVFLTREQPGVVILVAGSLILRVGDLFGGARTSSLSTSDGDRAARTDGTELVGGWMGVEVRVVGPPDAPWSAALAITPDATGTPVTATLVLPNDWPAADAFGLDVRISPGVTGTMALLDEVVVTRADHDPCARSVPEVLDHVLYATARSPDRRCAFGEGRSGVLVSTDGLSWTRGGGVADAVGATAPAWDPDTAMFRSAALVPAPDGSLTMVVGTSTDCDVWTTLGPAFATAPDPPIPWRPELLTDARLEVGYGYLVRRPRPVGPLVHEVWVTATRSVVLDAGVHEVRGVVRGISPDGSPGTFVLEPFVSLEEALGTPRSNPVFARAWGARVQVAAVGADRAYLVASAFPGSVSMFVDGPDGLAEVGSPILPPSGIPRTFDERAVLYGFLRMDPAPGADGWAGELTYGRLEAGTARMIVRSGAR